MKKKTYLKRGVLIILAAALITVIGGAVFVISRMNLVNRVSKENETQLPPEEETFEADEEPMDDTIGDGSAKESETVTVIAPEEVDWPDLDQDVMKDKEISNILLIGQDSRDPNVRSRSDSMIICSINRKDGSIKLTSIMRDLYVQIPGYSDNRINAAYAFGGMSLLDEVIEKNFGIHIDGNVEVNFAGFINAMSEIGNLDIELNEEEARYLSNNVSWIQQTNTGIDASDWHFSPGINSLTPEQALSYARIRYVGRADYERTERQRKVLTAAFNKVKDSDLKTLLRLTERILPNLTTDLTNAQIAGYVYTIISNHMEITSTYRIPVDGTFSSAMIRGMAVLVPDLNANREHLQQYIYGDSDN